VSELYPLLPAEIDEMHSFIHPNSTGLSAEEISKIQNLAIQAHKTLGLRHYSSTHFVLNRMGPYIVEVNILPSLSEESVFPKSLAATGVSLGEFLEHVIARATNR
jgi:D-alanine-D-alanine ligase